MMVHSIKEEVVSIYVSMVPEVCIYVSMYLWYLRDIDMIGGIRSINVSSLQLQKIFVTLGIIITSMVSDQRLLR